MNSFTSVLAALARRLPSLGAGKTPLNTTIRSGRVRPLVALAMATGTLSTTLVYSYGQASGVTVHAMPVNSIGTASTIEMPAFSATLNMAPTQHAECILTNGSERPSAWGGPEWSWEYTRTSNGVTTPVEGLDDDSTAGGISATGLAPGTYTITATATAKFKATECGANETPNATELSGSGSATITILQDTDGDGIPDDEDADADGDGVPDDEPTPTPEPTEEPTPTPPPSECDLYDHVTWTAFGNVIWEVDQQGELQAKMSGPAIEFRQWSNIAERPQHPDQYVPQTYVKTQQYDARDANGVWRRYVVFRADAACEDPGIASTWARASHILEGVDPEDGYGSAFLSVVQETEEATETEATQYEAINGAVGGQVYVALELSGTGIQSSQATIRFKEKDADHVHPDDAERQIDQPISFTHKDGWQKFYDPDIVTLANGTTQNGPKEEDWWPAPEAPQGQEGQYRYLMPWNTASSATLGSYYVAVQNPPVGQPKITTVSSKLWNHNGDHDIFLSTVDGEMGNTVSFGANADESVNSTYTHIKNIVISSVSPSEYFLVQPGQTSPVNFNVELDDYEPNGQYDLTLTIRHTSKPTEVLKTITKSGSGLSQSLSWDLTSDSSEEPTSFGGYYTFDLHVQRTGGSSQHYRSNSLFLNEDSIELAADSDGLALQSNGQNQVIFRYKLSETPKPSSVAVKFFSDLALLDEVSQQSGQNRWDASDPPITKWLSLGTSPSVRGIMTAEDDHAASYRNHQPKPMLNFNNGWSWKKVHAALTFNLEGIGTTNNPLMERQYEVRRVDADGNIIVDPNRPGVATPWSIKNQWNSNSSTNNMNSDNPNHYWQENGPIPKSDTVKENGSAGHYIVGVFTRIDDYSVSTPPNYYWCNADGSPTKFNVRGIMRYRTSRYGIANGSVFNDAKAMDTTNNEKFGYDYYSAANSHHNDSYPGVSRDALQIHEDAGQLGSAGCIAQRYDFERIWARLDVIWNSMSKSGRSRNDRYLPLFVYNRSGAGAAGPTASNWWQSK